MILRELCSTPAEKCRRDPPGFNFVSTRSVFSWVSMRYGEAYRFALSHCNSWQCSKSKKSVQSTNWGLTLRFSIAGLSGSLSDIAGAMVIRFEGEFA